MQDPRDTTPPAPRPIPGTTSGDGGLGRGAADIAPTAPHATASSSPTRAPVTRIWRSVGGVTAIALVLSLAAHVGVAVQAVGGNPEVEFDDLDDDLSIPVDLLEDFSPAVKAPEPVAAPDTTSTPGAPAVVMDAGAPLRVDAGSDAGPVDAGVTDAGRDAGADSGSDAATDASAEDGSVEGGVADDAGVGVGVGDAGIAQGGSGPRDPSSMIGIPGLVQTDENNVTLLVNMAAIRKHPVGARIGPLLGAIPQWNDFLQGAESAVDPLRDTDWILVYGPSLIRTERSAVLLRYSASDAVVDKALTIAGERYDKGGAYDVGVPGVKAVLGQADNAPRVFMRANSKLLAVVPEKKAKDFAKFLKSRMPNPKIAANEGMRLVVKKPSQQIAVRGLRFPTELTELRVWVVPLASGGAEIHAEGSVTEAEQCEPVASTMSEVFKNLNSGRVQFATGGLLNGLSIRCVDGVPQTKLLAERRQIEQMLSLISLVMGVSLGGAPTP